MKKNEIITLAQDQLNAIMAEGFILNLDEYSGSYSNVEGTHACFAKGNERVIVWREIKYGQYTDDDKYIGDVIILRVARFVKTDDQHFRWPNDWAEHTIFEKTLYHVGKKCNSDWYVESFDEALRCKELSFKRSAARRVSTERNVEVTDKVFAIARRIKGFKSIKRSDLRVTRTEHGWTFRNAVSRNYVTLRGGHRYGSF